MDDVGGAQLAQGRKPFRNDRATEAAQASFGGAIVRAAIRGVKKARRLGSFGGGASDVADLDDSADGSLYSVVVHAKATSGPDLIRP